MIKQTARIVAEYVRNNAVSVSELPNLIRSTFDALSRAGRAPEPAAAEKPVPAVPIRKSLTPAYLVCLDCGKHLKMLKRHLAVDHGLTPDGYRAKWGLGSDYPVVAPDYAEQRSGLARKIGLGTRRRVEG